LFEVGLARLLPKVLSSCQLLFVFKLAVKLRRAASATMMPTIPAAVLGLLWVTIPGVFSLAVPAEGLLERQNNVDCERPGLKTTNVTAATNETGILEKRNYNGVRDD
jgi:hypothetical protein